MEKEREVKSYEIKYYCDECQEEVIFTGLATLGNPQQFEHRCECGQTYWLKKQYPTIEYK